MVVRNGLAYLLLVLTLSACAVKGAAGDIQRIALLAPFEGRYREIGYDALYAARLALADSQRSHVELLAVDDGGSAITAADRLRALHDDPLVTLVVGVGYAAAQAGPPPAADPPLPLLLVGHWGASPANHTWVLSNNTIGEIVTIPAGIDSITAAAGLPTPLICPDICGLKQFSQLTPDTAQVTVVSSASLPPADFSERYQQSDPFAPEPGLLATLTYDAVTIALEATQAQTTRSEISTYLDTTTFNGLNGAIRFQDGYWVNAPVHEYRYTGQGQLVLN